MQPSLEKNRPNEVWTPRAQEIFVVSSSMLRSFWIVPVTWKQEVNCVSHLPPWDKSYTLIPFFPPVSGTYKHMNSKLSAIYLAVVYVAVSAYGCSFDWH